MATAGSHLQQLLHAGPLDRLGDGEREVASQVVDGFALDVLDESTVAGRVGIELVVLDELPRVLGPGQIQSMPIDDRAPTQDQIQRFQVM